MTYAETRAQEQARQETRYVQVEAVARDLADGYAMLPHVLEPEKRGTVTASGTAGSKSPADDDVIDMHRNVDLMVDEIMPKARGALRMGLIVRPMQWVPRGTSRHAATLTALQWLAKAFRQIDQNAPETGEWIERNLRKAAGHIGPRTTRTGEAPYLSTRACSDCGATHVYVHPTRRVARCVTCKTYQEATSPVG